MSLPPSSEHLFAALGLSPEQWAEAIEAINRLVAQVKAEGLRRFEAVMRRVSIRARQTRREIDAAPLYRAREQSLALRYRRAGDRAGARRPGARERVRKGRRRGARV